MTRFLRRARLWWWFLGRPLDGPNRDEVWTWRDHLMARCGPGLAWTLACVLED